PTGVYNLAGKHVNNEGDCWGTPFDLSTLSGEVNVMNGLVDLNSIRFVRIVDIVGNGNQLDSEDNPIYDPSLTGLFGAGGFDLDAIGAIGQARSFSDWSNGQGYARDGDDDGDGVSNLLEYAFDMDPEVPDVSGLPRLMMVDGHPKISFSRDIRNGDIIYIVEATDSLTDPDWHEVARAEAFSDPVVSDTGILVSSVSTESRHTQANLDVWQEVSFTDMAVDSIRFYRVRVETVDE
ncbi:MAG: hypothetical protein ACQKBW_06075, partial [Puniceicoccales bacterium]